MESNLKNKTALIIGGNGLIGKALCNALEGEGANVVNGDISNESKITKTESNIYNIKIDSLSEESVERAIDQIEKDVGPINTLINSSYPKNSKFMEDFLEAECESWVDNIAIQIKACFLTTQRVARRMVYNNNGGSIINIGSIYGIVGPDFSIYKDTSMTNPSSYSVIKGGIISFSRYLAVYLAPYGIRVNTISPGGVFNKQSEGFVKEYSKKTPAKRMAVPEDIAGAAIFLASDLSGYVTGHNLVVDGGWTIT